MKKVYFLFNVCTLLLVMAGLTTSAQVGGVAINTAGAQPDSSAVLDVSSITKGELMPRMTTVQRDAIVNPAEGLTIYNTDCHVFNFNAGTPANPNWATLNSSNALVASVSIAANPIGAICAGSTVTFTATPGQNNLSPAYQWQVNGNNVAGATNSIFTDSTLNNGDVVNCVLTSSVPCVTGSPATSNGLTMLVNIVPVITGTAPAVFCSGGAVTLGASANLGTINWYSAATGGSSLSSGASFLVAGLTGSTTYYVDASANGCTTPGRTPVTATYYPTLANQPGAINGPVGDSLNSTALYYISPVGDVENYSWVVVLGRITSGQGTDSIYVNWDSIGFGSISVASNNPCGTSTAQTEIINIQSQLFTATDSGYSGNIQTFTAPVTATYIITAYGAQGGNSATAGGLGAMMQGNFTLTQGQQLSILVGQAGATISNTSYQGSGGGGGGTFVVSDGNLLIAAGGGGGGGDGVPGGPGLTTTIGGSSTGGNTSTGGSINSGGSAGTGSYYPGGGGGGAACCNGQDGNYGGGLGGGGGAGYTGNGGSGENSPVDAYSYINGGTGGYHNNDSYGSPQNSYGGYGGGGTGVYFNYESGGGGGGGYTGGGGGSGYGIAGGGGGGGSYNSGTNQNSAQGVQSGNGQVIISWN